MLARRNILLTGATGLIGGELAICLSDSGHAVSTLVRAANLREGRQRISTRFGRSRRALNGCVFPALGNLHEPLCGIAEARSRDLETRCEIVVHCAAETSFRRGGECHRTNVEGTRNILGLASKLRNLQHFYYVSSAVVCTSPPGSVITEDAPIAGYANDYVASKREAERLVRTSGLPFTILRPSIVVSHGLEDRAFARAILWFFRLAVECGQLPLGGSERVDFVPVGFVVAAISKLVERSAKGDCYHISAGAARSVTFAEITQRLFEAGFGKSPVQFGADVTEISPRFSALFQHYLPFSQADVVYSNEKLLSELGDDVADCPAFTEYCADLLGLITPCEALAESELP